MRTTVAQVSLAAIALVIGIALVAQFRSQSRPTELTSLPVAELSTRIQTLSEANRQLRLALAQQNDLLEDYEGAEAEGASALDVSREELRRIEAFSSAMAVEGQGIIVRVDGDLDAIAVNDLLNELRNAGAEALAINDARITAGSVVVQRTDSLEVDGHAIGRTFRLSAVGDADGLLAALQRPGGIVAQLEQFVNATITISPSTTIQLPATERDLAPTIAVPIE